MTDDFVDKLRLQEAAEEDIYFARLDRQLIAALREKRRRHLEECQAPGEKDSRPLDAPALGPGRRDA